MNLTVPDSGYPMTVVSDGRILAENLRRGGRDERWLQARLKEHQIKNAEEVFLMTVDNAGKIYLVRKEPV